MKADFTRIAVVLDRSGSMESVREATVAGFNEFIRQQRALPGEVRLRLVQFDDVIETVFDKPLRDVPELTASTFVPRGSTALFDAQGKTIDELGAELGRMPEPERPERVIVITLTDGMENASKRYTRARVAEMIQHQRDKYGWQFLYLGANQDAVAVAASMNIAPACSITFSASPVGMRNTMAAVSNQVSFSRKREANAGFTEQDRLSALQSAEDKQPA